MNITNILGEDKMQKRFILAIIIFIVVLSMMLSACARTTTTMSPTTAAPTTAAPTTVAPTTTQDKWWDTFGEPQYGGDITIRTMFVAGNFDPYNPIAGGMLSMYETLFSPDWITDRSTSGFFKTWYIPTEYRSGLLVKDWEMTDSSTITIYLQEGIHWQNKTPVNGREFTAADVQNHYDRIMGVGDYSEPSGYYTSEIATIDSVTATDKYTIVFKFKNPGLSNFVLISEPDSFNFIESPEADKLEPGGLKDWENAVGTSPWVLTDYVASTSMEYSKNSNYWGYDERYPQNKLPYMDTFKLLVIPDTQTGLAALRTSKIDFMDGISLTDAKNLATSNPQLVQVQAPAIGSSVLLRCDSVPFKDIKVRKALQMSLDLKTIATGYYKGIVDGTPAGLISPELQGYAFAYTDWPQDLKDEYTYNPTKAKELLAEAGYPDGFKTDIVTSTTSDLQLLQVIKSYFSDIGVDMDIQTMDIATWYSFVPAGKHDQMSFAEATGFTFAPDFDLAQRYTKNSNNYTFNSDPAYDAIVDKFNSATTATEAAQLAQQADRYCIEQHWTVNTFPLVSYIVLQPGIEGYSGEPLGWGQTQMLAKIWRTQSTK